MHAPDFQDALDEAALSFAILRGPMKTKTNHDDSYPQGISRKVGTPTDGKNGEHEGNPSEKRKTGNRMSTSKPLNPKLGKKTKVSKGHHSPMCPRCVRVILDHTCVMAIPPFSSKTIPTRHGCYGDVSSPCFRPFKINTTRATTLGFTNQSQPVSTEHANGSPQDHFCTGIW